MADKGQASKGEGATSISFNQASEADDNLALMAVLLVAGPLILAGFVTTIAGIIVLLAMVKGHPGAWYFAPGLFLIGTGLGVMLTPSVNVVQSAFPEILQGEISGLSRSISNLGSSFGTAIAWRSRSQRQLHPRGERHLKCVDPFGSSVLASQGKLSMVVLMEALGACSGRWSSPDARAKPVRVQAAERSCDV
jgi:hypothetical protein